MSATQRRPLLWPAKVRLTVESRSTQGAIFMGNVLGRALLACVLAVLYWGGSCNVSYCSEDCNPCISECKCHTRTCRPSTAADFQEAHQLTAFRESVWVEASGRTTRVWSEIGGLSVARATGRADTGAGDLARFAQGVLQVNEAVLRIRDGSRWVFDTLQTFDAVSIVAYESRPEGSTLSLLFDRKGNLLEIDEVFATR